MNLKIIVFILGIATIVCAQDKNKNYAFDVSCGLVNGNSMYFPVPSVSFYWLKNKGLHELSAEFYTKETDTNSTQTTRESSVGFGLSYSFLFKLPVRFIYLGPTIGLLSYWTSKEFYNYDYHGYYSMEYDGKSGKYFCGLKSALIFGNSTVRFKIQDRFLFGITDNNDVSSYGVLNTVNVSLIFAF